MVAGTEKADILFLKEAVAFIGKFHWPCRPINDKYFAVQTAGVTEAQE